MLGLLDEHAGGAFSLRPAGDARVESREYAGASLVLRTVWRAGAARLVVEEALRLGGEPALIRAVHAEGGGVPVDIEIRAPGPLPGRHDDVRAKDGRLSIAARGDAAAIDVHAPAPWSVAGGTARARFVASSTRSLVALTATGAPVHAVAAPRAPVDALTALALDDTRERWQRRLAGIAGVPLRPEAVRVLGEAHCRRLLDVSAAVLVGLTHVAGGIVAAPTCSLPQWPGSARCWDYRFCWLRDAALAGSALLRLGLVDEAWSLGAFIGGVTAAHGVRPMVRVDGADAPEERVRMELSGYRGATPVRFGNAAAQQFQLDVGGEVLDLAHQLATAGALPEALATAAPGIAGWIAEHWSEPDHGIWEIRGAARPYTHSQVMAWVGLDRAARLAGTGSIRGDGASWRATAHAVRAHVLDRPRQPLQLHHRSGGADAALSSIVEHGFVARDDPAVGATLDLIAARLDRDGVLDRYEGVRDPLPDTSAPFVFPTFWMATAAGAAGRDGGRWLRAAAASCGPLGLYGEVVDPATGGPLGNYPQVQSHAALVTALTARS